VDFLWVYREGRVWLARVYQTDQKHCRPLRCADEKGGVKELAVGVEVLRRVTVLCGPVLSGDVAATSPGPEKV
jgi:hypothetical protein